MKIVICGAGIAGLTAASWLARSGHRVVLVERAPRLRGEGFMLDFFGSGYDVGERMGLLGAFEEIHYPIPHLAFVEPSGRETLSLPYARFRALFDGRHFNFLRGDLERVLAASLPSSVELARATEISAFRSHADGVDVEVGTGRSERFDLLIGADGTRSRIREHVLGADIAAGAIRDLGYVCAAWTIEDERLHREHDGAFRTLSVPDRQVGIYPVRGGKLAAFFVHRRSAAHAGSPRDQLRATYGDLGWVVPELLARIPDDGSLYFDAVEQVVAPRWSAGRVVLLGDSCQAVSLLAGQGASMAMGAAWALATELGPADADLAHDGLVAALARYEARVRPAIERKQRAGRSAADWFVPKSRARIAVRDWIMRASVQPGLGWIAKRAFSSESIVV